MDKKLNKVEFHYDNGTVKYITGKNLELWSKAGETCSMLQWAHGGKTGFEDVKWKIRKDQQ